MDTIAKLAEAFEKFPGIGPRQAQRFVFYLLRTSKTNRNAIVQAILSLDSAVRQCPKCMRFHDGREGACSICASSVRDDAQLMVVATDSDLRAVEHANLYRGRYFVLGGLVSLSANRAVPLRESELLARMKEMEELSEVILALPANPEGDATADKLHALLAEPTVQRDITVSELGRGLSTGSELEYADAATIQAALDGRR